MSVPCPVLSGRSFIKHKKRTGPRCDPWGTPDVTECFAEDEEPTRTDIMASNAMSRIENQDRTCLVQILLSHTFLP